VTHRGAWFAVLLACSACTTPCRDTPRSYTFCESADDANAVVEGQLVARGGVSEAGPQECPTDYRSFTFSPERTWPSSWDGGTEAFAVEGDLGEVADGTPGLFFLVLSSGRAQLHVDGFYAREDGGFRLEGRPGNPLLSADEVRRQVQRVTDGESCLAPPNVP
jgi:hypothetical protein